MALNIKDPIAVALAAEVARLAGESKTRAVRTALEERKQRLEGRKRQVDKHERLMDFLENELWPQIPADVRGKPLTKAEREEILGIGPEGF
jgi:antitoxin VapB